MSALLNAITMIVDMNHAAFIEAYDQLPETDESILARRIYNCLVGSSVFEISCLVQDTKCVAQFFHDDDEICRAVVGRGQHNGVTHREAWICKRRNDSPEDWPASRKTDFHNRFGFEARAGNAIIRWCDENRDRVNELVRWLIAQAVSEDQAAELTVDIDTGSVFPLSRREGQRRLIVQDLPYRDASLPEAKRRQIRECNNGLLVCAWCGTRSDGVWDDRAFEIHHEDPLNRGERETTLDDLTCLCRNCHGCSH